LFYYVLMNANETNTKNTRAKVGGETGMNGQHYDGGQFLPNTTMGKKTKSKRSKGSGKQEIAPYVWEVAPEGKRSIFAKYNTMWTWDVKGVSFKLFSGLNPDYYSNAVLLEAQEAAKLWNSGQRWI